MTIFRGLAAMLLPAVLALALPAIANEVLPPDAVVLHDTPEQERLRLSRGLASADAEVRSRACHAFEYSGISDPLLMGRVADWVETNFVRTHAEGFIPAEQPECVRALASSGDLRYRPILQRAVDLRPARGAGYRFVRAHLQRSLEVLPLYAAWNAQINLRDTTRPGQPWPVTRALNLLRSPEFLLQREGLARARALAPLHPPLYADLAARLELELARPGGDPERIDFAAHLCRALAESRDPRYAGLLQRAAADAQPAKLRKHARRALDELHDG